MGVHLIDGTFQSDKYPTTPRGKVPLSVKDKSAQDLLWKYAQRRREVDAEFSDDLEAALITAGYVPPVAIPMILTCPLCSARHIDEGEFATKIHVDHSCQSCGLTWRPATVPTVGVQFLPGYKNKETDKAPTMGLVGGRGPLSVATVPCASCFGAGTVGGDLVLSSNPPQYTTKVCGRCNGSGIEPTPVKIVPRCAHCMAHNGFDEFNKCLTCGAWNNLTEQTTGILRHG